MSPSLVHSCIRHHAEVRPDAPAVCDALHCLSYARLEQLSSRYALALREAGARPGQRIALQLDRSARAIVALVGILKAGCAYVPIDPQQPRSWQERVLRGTAPALIVATAPGDGIVAPPNLDDDRPDAAGFDIADEPGIDPTIPMYVIHTSGSSGEPKGVEVSHANVARLFPALSGHIEFDHRDVWAQSHSLSFGFSVWELWGALWHGGLLVVVPASLAMSPARLVDLLAREKVTVLSQTPTAFRQFCRVLAADADRALPDLRVIAFSGEPLDPRVIAPWLSRFGDDRPLLANLYALTETAGEVAFHRVTRDDLLDEPNGLIGKPLHDTRFHLLDADGLPVEDGEIGELFIGGPSIAKGYLDRPELTAERFRRDPFANDGSRMYRSGDLAQRMPDGRYRFVGRADRQIKIRGYRLEPSLVEAALAEHPSVLDAVVLSYQDGGETRLGAWVVPVAPGDLPTGLRSELAQRLPHYAVPDSVFSIGSLPLTSNGKLDEAALRNCAASSGATSPTKKPAVTRDVVVTAWRELLQIEDFTDQADFFDLGGDSLLTLDLSLRLEEHFAIGLTMADIFENPTLGELVAFVDTAIARWQSDSPDRSGLPPDAQKDEGHAEHVEHMRVAIAQARKAIEEGQPPYAACIVRHGKVIVSGHNMVWRDNDPTAHAEIRMIREACHVLGTTDLSGCTLYSTAEPCSMCLTACAWANIDHIVYSVGMEDEERYGLSRRTVSAETMIRLLDRPLRLVPSVRRAEMREVFETWLRIAALG